MADSRPIGPFLYLPIEVASREPHAKLLLTYFAVARGYEAVIGWKRMINENLRYMPPGLVMFKTLTANDGEAMAAARAAGHRVAAIDEEVPGRPGRAVRPARVSSARSNDSRGSRIAG